MILSKSGMRWRGVASALALATGLLAAQSALAQSEQVLVKRPSQLRDSPAESGRVIQPLPAQTALTRLAERQGPWVRVKLADGSAGWVHMFDISSASGGIVSNAGTGALRSLSGFFNKGSAQAPAGGNVATSTIGIRGLGAEELNNAIPNLAAVAQADAARLDAAQARQFAALSSLSSRQVAPLPEPVAPPAAARQNSNSNSNGNNNNAELFSR